MRHGRGLYANQCHIMQGGFKQTTSQQESRIKDVVVLDRSKQTVFEGKFESEIKRAHQ